MTLEERRANVLINKAGGTSGPEGRSYRVVLSPVWVKQLGITENSREVLLQFDGESITIRRVGTGEYAAFLNEAREKKHDLLVLHYYDGENLCTRICADRTARRLAIENKTADVLSTAFGVDQNPNWEDLVAFLESRCIPRQRDGLQHYLTRLGLERYDPLEIIRKTEGRMAEDDCWIKIVEG